MKVPPGIRVSFRVVFVRGDGIRRESNVDLFPEPSVTMDGFLPWAMQHIRKFCSVLEGKPVSWIITGIHYGRKDVLHVEYDLPDGAPAPDTRNIGLMDDSEGDPEGVPSVVDGSSV